MVLKDHVGMHHRSYSFIFQMLIENFYICQENLSCRKSLLHPILIRPFLKVLIRVVLRR